MIYESTDIVDIALAEAALSKADIPYFKKNHHTQNVMSDTALYSGIDAIAGLVYSAAFLRSADYQSKCNVLGKKQESGDTTCTLFLAGNGARA